MVCSDAQSCLTLVIPWTVACQAPLSVGFSRQNTGVGCHALLQGMFLTQALNPCLLDIQYWQVGFFFFFTTNTTWEAYIYIYICFYIYKVPLASLPYLIAFETYNYYCVA